jgi:ArsR family transcriptional regulator
VIYPFNHQFRTRPGYIDFPVRICHNNIEYLFKCSIEISKMRKLATALQCDPDEHVDTTAVVRAQQSLPDGSTLTRMSEIFAALGDTTRLRLLIALSRQPLCVHELSEVLGVSVSAVSHQLRTLKMLKLVSAQRAGKRVYYSLDDVHVHHLIAEGLKHALER